MLFRFCGKNAFIYPILKSGNENDISNYRPIDILSAISKVIDKIVAKLSSFTLLDILVTEQHGFLNVG